LPSKLPPWEGRGKEEVVWQLFCIQYGPEQWHTDLVEHIQAGVEYINQDYKGVLQEVNEALIELRAARSPNITAAIPLFHAVLLRHQLLALGSDEPPVLDLVILLFSIWENMEVLDDYSQVVCLADSIAGAVKKAKGDVTIPPAFSGTMEELAQAASEVSSLCQVTKESLCRIRELFGYLYRCMQDWHATLGDLEAVLMQRHV
jgi:hypothetical protein